MVNYQLGKIYTVRSLTSPEIYVGSTCMILCKRMTMHRSDWKKGVILGKNKDIVKDINEWYIELYENYPCEKVEELTAREGVIIREIGTLNKNIAGRTKKQYYTDNKEEIKQYYTDNKEEIKQYYTEHKDDAKQYQKQYYTDNKEKKKQYYTDNKQTHKEELKQYDKQYYLKNADKIKERRKEYYLKNADKIKQKNKKYRIDNADKIKEIRNEYYLKNKLAKSQIIIE